MVDYEGIVHELRARLAGVNEAITAFERVASGGAPRRGRPLKWLSNVDPPPPGRAPQSSGKGSRNADA